jgi:hypothetical protein
MRGRAIRLSVPRRMIIDLLYFARGIPTIPVQKRMSLAALIAARRMCSQRPRWISLFTKGYALVAQEFPELRRAYVKLPWPQLYEYPTSRANIMIERDYLGESAVCPVSIKDPAHQSLRDIGRLIEHASTAPVEDLKDFRRWTQFARLPRFLRRLFWWVGLNWGRQRGNYFGTFGLSVYSALKAESLHPLAPATTVLNYGVIGKDGLLDVRIIYDHRVVNGATIARALGRLEEILNSEIAEEVRSMANRTD